MKAAAIKEKRLFKCDFLSKKAKGLKNKTFKVVF